MSHRSHREHRFFINSVNIEKNKKLEPTLEASAELNLFNLCLARRRKTIVKTPSNKELRIYGNTEVCSIAADKRIHETTDLQTFAFLIKIIR